MNVKCNVSHKTCLEKGMVEEQVYGECKREKRKKKQNGWRIFHLFYSRQITGEAGTSHDHTAQLGGGDSVARKAGLCVGNGV
jgi:hypothetical protein